MGNTFAAGFIRVLKMSLRVLPRHVLAAPLEIPQRGISRFEKILALPDRHYRGNLARSNFLDAALNTPRHPQNSRPFPNERKARRSTLMRRDLSVLSIYE